MNASAEGGMAGEPGAERQFVVDGSEWIVRSGGEGAAGTGRQGLAPVEAVHFYRPGEDRPRYEALLARGLWLQLFDTELAALLRMAVPVPPAV
jgi:hypothetical protein